MSFSLSTLQAISVNSGYTSNIEINTTSTLQQFGNKTECALLGFVHLLGCDYRTIRKRVPESNFVKGFELFSLDGSELCNNKGNVLCSFMVLYSFTY